MRQIILDAAAEVFSEIGYGNATVADVVARAGVSRGACNYHFPTKESLAAALIEYCEDTLWKRGRSVVSESASPLENLIRATFAQINLVQQDAKVAVGIQLANAQTQVSGSTTRGVIPKWPALFEAALEAAVVAGDLESRVLGRDVGYVLWCSMVGTNQMAVASGRDPIEALAVVWRVHLDGIVPSESAAYFDQLVRRIAAQYARHQATA